MDINATYLVKENGGGNIAVVNKVSFEKIAEICKDEFGSEFKISHIKFNEIGEYFEVWLYANEETLMERILTFEKIEVY